MGALPFLRLVSELALTSQLLYIGLAVLMRQQLAPAAGWALLRSCAVGFSGVLFGLKVQLACECLVFLWDSMLGLLGEGACWHFTRPPCSACHPNHLVMQAML